jgi:hypothetical protein
MTSTSLKFHLLLISQVTTHNMHSFFFFFIFCLPKLGVRETLMQAMERGVMSGI